MPKFIIEDSQIKEDVITIAGFDFRHIKTVLRKEVGDKLILSDNTNDYNCIIQEIKDDSLILRIETIEKAISEPEVKVTLFQSLPKLDKMEIIIQKCVEIGITSIIPMQTSRTIVKINNAEKERKKIERWNKISEAASKQCGRNSIPKIEKIMTFNESVECAKKLDSAIIPYEKEQNNTIKQFIHSFTGESIGIFIGPEGGFSNSEINIAVENKITPITLGNRILRTETAGLYTLAIIIYELG